MPPPEGTAGFTLNAAPPIYVLPSHLLSEDLHETEDLIFSLGGSLTYDPKEARIFLGKVGHKKRAAFDLRAKGVWTEESALPEVEVEQGSNNGEAEEEDGPPRKRVKTGWIERDVKAETRQGQGRKSSTSSTASSDRSTSTNSPPPQQVSWPDLTNHIVVLKLGWLESCINQHRLVPYKPYIVYSAQLVSKPAGESSPSPNALPSKTTHVKPDPEPSSASSSRPKSNTATSILERAKAEAATLPPSTTSHPVRRRYGEHSGHQSSQPKHPPKLHRTTTSEFEDLANNPLPPLPEWAMGPHAHYSCCRSTPMHTRNAAFIAQLSKIKEARLLTLDDIGVRAYSTSIASLSAYEHHIRHPEEITRLPGCEAKIATLWSEWYHSADTDGERYIQTVRDLDSDPDLQHLRLFWNIWGVGPETARKFYFERGWKDLDDVVEFGWNTLSRVQQIGVKFYDQFISKIPRAEVESISDVILRHARLVLGVKPSQHNTTEDVECIIVGGYRRGKLECGDVDVVLSHRDENKTKDLVVEVVRSLEREGWITHTLTLNTTTSDRGQATLPYHGSHRGHGFDSLDKALCVWQDPHFDAPAPAPLEGEGNVHVNVKNPNIHRRVDIIISSWRTVGCAMLGWSGGTTFQRDIRQFVAKTRGLKFDSSGVRDRSNGLVLDFEAGRPKTKEALEAVFKGKPPVAKPGDEWDDKDTWQDRERRLMDGLGFGYRPPHERCTG
ncbi:hypothetical protein LTR20_003348 [Exophiala xenobiotica]|nr:hypothetical protein LTR90_003977 [Exophiala xenobiotica]KAK5466401.1 hypothetical protein LTR20_003348 [Exophiala xenobiotica]